MRNVFALFCTGIITLCLFSHAAADNEQHQVVRQAQESLKKLRYYTMAVDGTFGPKTRKAVLQYQYEMNLPITGTLDSTTIRSLKRPSLVLLTQNFAPFHYTASRINEADGPIPQIVKLACEKAGINCRILLYDQWGLAQEDVKNGGADGIFVVAWNSQRAKWLRRSTAIIETEYGLFVRDTDNVQFEETLYNPSLLEGYTIGVYGPSGTSSSLIKLRNSLRNKGVNISIDMCGDDRPLFRKLSLSEEKNGVYSNRIVGESIIKGMALNNVRYAGPHRGLTYYVGFSKQLVSSALVEKFNQAYLSLVDQGDVISILANHNMPIPNNINKSFNTDIGRDDQEKTHSKRFTQMVLHSAPVVIDATTCLMWQQSGTKKHCNWLDALTYVEKLNSENYAGFSDWRLPLIDELNSLLEKERQKSNNMHIHPVFDTFQQTCWSNDKKDMDIKFIDFFDGASGSKNQGDTNFVRAVRDTKCKKI